MNSNIESGEILTTLVSAQEASAFVLEHMPNAPRFPTPHDTLRHALSLAPPEGLALEFGVAAGNTLKVIAGVHEGRDVYGCDWCEGFPEDWRTGFPKVFFKMDEPEVAGAEIIVGWFEDTLPAFLKEHDEPVAFIHADGGLYSSTITILDNLYDRLVPCVVIQFEECFNYPGWRDHECRAGVEFVEPTGLEFDYVAYSADNEQVVVRVR